MKEKPLYWKFLLLIALVLPLLVYVTAIELYGVNTPYKDDFALKGFLTQFNKADSWSIKWQLILSQHHENRLIFAHLLTLLFSFSKKVVQYKALMWVGNVLLIGVVGLYARFFKKNIISRLYLLPIPWLLFALTHYDNTFHALASIEVYGGLFFSLWAFLALWNNQLIRLSVALVLAICTSVYGFVALLVIAFMLLVKKSWMHLLAVLWLGAMLGWLYFTGYENTWKGNVGDLSLTQGILALMGSYVDTTLNTLVTNRLMFVLLAGGVVAALTLFCIIKNIPFDMQTLSFDFPRRWPVFILCVIGFIIGIAVLTIRHPANQDMATLLGSKYKIYSAVLVASLYGWSINNFAPQYRNVILGCFMPFCMFIYGHSWLGNMGLLNHRYKHTAMGLLANSSDETLAGVDPEVEQSVGKLLGESLKNKPTLPLQEARVRNKTIVVKGRAKFTFSSLHPDDGIYLLAKSKKKLYIFPLKKSQEESQPEEHFEGEIPTEALQEGAYKLGLYVVQESEKQIFNTGETIRVEHN